MQFVPVTTDVYRAISSPVVLPVSAPSVVPAVVSTATPPLVQTVVSTATPPLVQAAVATTPPLVQAAVVPATPSPIQTPVQTSDPSAGQPPSSQDPAPQPPSSQDPAPQPPSDPAESVVLTRDPEQVAADAAKEALVAKEEMVRNAEVQDMERKVALDEFEKAESALERAKQDYDEKSEALFRETREADRAAETAMKVSLSSEEAERYAEEAKRLSGGGEGDGDGVEGDAVMPSAMHEGEHWFVGILKHPFTWIVLSLLVAAIVFSVFFHSGSGQKEGEERKGGRNEKRKEQEGTTLILEWNLGRDPVHEDKLFAINSDSQSFVCSLKEVFKGQNKKARIVVPGEDAAVRAVLKDGTQHVCSLNESNKITMTEERSSVCSTTTEKEEDIPLQKDAMKPYVE